MHLMGELARSMDGGQDPRVFGDNRELLGLLYGRGPRNPPSALAELWRGTRGGQEWVRRLAHGPGFVQNPGKRWRGQRQSRGRRSLGERRRPIVYRFL